MADQQRLQISELHLEDQIQNQSNLISKDCRSRNFIWKIRFKTKVSSCSGFPSDAMLWIKEVEKVESVDDLKSSPKI